MEDAGVPGGSTRGLPRDGGPPGPEGPALPGPDDKPDAPDDGEELRAAGDGKGSERIEEVAVLHKDDEKGEEDAPVTSDSTAAKELTEPDGEEEVDMKRGKSSCRGCSGSAEASAAGGTASLLGAERALFRTDSRALRFSSTNERVSCTGFSESAANTCNTLSLVMLR